MKFKYLEMIKTNKDVGGSPLTKGDIVLYLGEIPNMKGHIVFSYGGRIFYGYHPENFTKIPKEEL
jgi:hypothetical protein